MNSSADHKPARAFATCEVEDGRNIHYLLEGPADAPVVLYDAGAFGIYADGWWVKEALKSDFRVILYDRAGMGASDPVPEGCTPSPQWHVEDMRRLLSALGVTEQIILIGHSMAGLRLHTFANLYPDLLRGMVLVDALSPRDLKKQVSRFMQDQFRLVLKAGAYGAKLGLAEPASRLAPNNFRLEGVMRRDKTHSYASATHHQASRDEVHAIDYDADYLHGDGITKLPLAIFASTAINGMREEDANRAKAQSGFGWWGHFPREDHVSVLTGIYAEAIGWRVREIHAHTTQSSAKAAAG